MVDKILDLSDPKYKQLFFLEPFTMMEGFVVYGNTDFINVVYRQGILQTMYHAIFLDMFRIII